MHAGIPVCVGVCMYAVPASICKQEYLHAYACAGACMYTHFSACTRVHTGICRQVFLFANACRYSSVFPSVCERIDGQYMCVRRHMHVCILERMHTCMHVHAGIPIHVCMCMQVFLSFLQRMYTFVYACKHTSAYTLDNVCIRYTMQMYAYDIQYTIYNRRTKLRLHTHVNIPQHTQWTMYVYGRTCMQITSEYVYGFTNTDTNIYLYTHTAYALRSEG